MRERGRVRMIKSAEKPVRMRAQGPGPVGSAENIRGVRINIAVSSSVSMVRPLNLTRGSSFIMGLFIALSAAARICF